MADQTHAGLKEEWREQGTESHVWQFAEDLAGTLVSPGETLRSIGQRGAIIEALFLVFIIVGIGALAQVTVLLLNLFQVPGFTSSMMATQAGTIAAVQLSGILWNFVWVPVFWTIIALMLYGVAYLLGGRGRFISLWAASGFALAPQLLVAPVQAASEMLGALGLGWQLLGWLFVIPVTVVAFVWTIILYAIAVRETMSVSTGRALGAMGLLIGVMVTVAVVLAIIFFLLIAALIAAIAAG